MKIIPKFIKGEPVQLTGGSINMTIIDFEIDEENNQISYECTWIDSKGYAQFQEYDEEVLKSSRQIMK